VCGRPGHFLLFALSAARGEDERLAVCGRPGHFLLFATSEDEGLVENRRTAA